MEDLNADLDLREYDFDSYDIQGEVRVNKTVKQFPSRISKSNLETSSHFTKILFFPDSENTHLKYVLSRLENAQSSIDLCGYDLGNTELYDSVREAA